MHSCSQQDQLKITTQNSQTRQPCWRKRLNNYVLRLRPTNLNFQVCICVRLLVQLWLCACMRMCAVDLQIALAERAHYHSKTPIISAKDSSISYSDSLQTHDSLMHAFAVALALALPHTLSEKLLEILKNTGRAKTYNIWIVQVRLERNESQRQSEHYRGLWRLFQ